MTVRNKYIDYLAAYGPIITGHAHPHVTEVTKVLGRVDMCMYCNEPLTLDPKLEGEEFNEDYNKKRSR